MGQNKKIDSDNIILDFFDPSDVEFSMNLLDKHLDSLELNDETKELNYVRSVLPLEARKLVKDIILNPPNYQPARLLMLAIKERSFSLEAQKPNHKFSLEQIYKHKPSMILLRVRDVLNDVSEEDLLRIYKNFLPNCLHSTIDRLQNYVELDAIAMFADVVYMENVKMFPNARKCTDTNNAVDVAQKVDLLESSFLSTLEILEVSSRSKNRNKNLEAELTQVSEAEPSHASEVEPSHASEVEPSHASEVELSQASEVELSQASEVEPRQASEVEPRQASEVEPSQAYEVEPSQAYEVELSQASEVELSQASEVELSQASEVELSQASEVELSQASEVELSQASEVELSQVSEVQLSQVSEVQLSQISEVQLSQVTEAEPSPLSKAKLCRLSQPGPDQQSALGPRLVSKAKMNRTSNGPFSRNAK